MGHARPKESSGFSGRPAAGISVPGSVLLPDGSVLASCEGLRHQETPNRACRNSAHWKRLRCVRSF